MQSYDEIRAHLEAELAHAINAHAAGHQSETAKLLRVAQERYDRFVLHGILPDEFAEDTPE